jgi:hypothetical protein
MSELSHQGHDTFIHALPFMDGADRRQSARVPCAMRVHLGPPKAPPETTLVAEDISTGGLFIRCGQAVQVGARFSMHIERDDGERIYVPEAEVLYNYQAEDDPKRGFGARFVSVGREAMQKIVASASFTSDVAVTKEREVSSSMIVRSTEEIPVPRIGDTISIRIDDLPRVSDLRLSSTTPPMTPIAIEDEEEEQLEAPIAEEIEMHGDDMHDGIDWQPREVRERAQSPLKRIARRVRERPFTWVVSTAIGAISLVVLASVVAKRGSSDAYASRPADAPPRVSAETHRALLDPKPALVGVAPMPAQAEPAPVTNPLPKLVVIDPPAKAQPVKQDAPKQEPLAKPKAPEKAPSAPPAGKVEKSPAAVLRLSANAKVLKTHVLKAPHRFVVDLGAQTGTPELVSKNGVSAPRFGAHPDFVRVVFDSPRAIVRGEVSKKGDRLEVRLEN